MPGTFVFVISLIYVGLVIYVVTLLSRFVSAWERISQNVEIGVSAWAKDLRAQSRGSEPKPPAE
jgi:hypothetical protein